MGLTKTLMAAAAAVLALGVLTAPRAEAGPLDGFAGAAVGFALGAMVAGRRPVYYAPRARRVVVYGARPARVRYAAPPLRRYAAAPVRRRAASGGGVPVNTAADPFAGSASAGSVPVNGR